MSRPRAYSEGAFLAINTAPAIFFTHMRPGLIRIAAWRPRPSGPGGNAASPSRKMSVASDSVFACPGTGCSPRPPRKRCWPYLERGGLPQVFNFQLILAGWRAAEFRAAIDSALAVTGGSRAPWVIGNHDVARPASRYRLDEGFIPQTVSRLIALGDQNADAGARRARAAALVLLALPGSAYIFQGEELGLPEVTDIGDGARQDPRFFRTKGEYPGRDGCRVPLPWSGSGTGFGFSRTGHGSSPPEPWLPQPADWGRYSVESQLADKHSTLNLYRAALRLRRGPPRPGSERAGPGRAALVWPGRRQAALLRPGARIRPRRQPRPGAGAAARPPRGAARQRARGRRQPAAPTPPPGSALEAGRLRPHSAFIQQIALRWRLCRR